MSNDISNYLISHDEDDSASYLRDEDVTIGSNTNREINSELETSNRMNAKQQVLCNNS